MPRFDRPGPDKKPGSDGSMPYVVPLPPNRPGLGSGHTPTPADLDRFAGVTNTASPTPPAKRTTNYPK